MGTNNNVTAELCHAIYVMQTCQGSARYKISEFFLECTIGLYDMRVHNKRNPYSLNTVIFCEPALRVQCFVAVCAEKR